MAATTEQEFLNRVRELEDRRRKEILDPGDPCPDEFKPWWPAFWDHSVASQETFPTPEDKVNHDKKMKPWREWEQRERRRYDDLKNKAKQEAREAAEKRVPMSIDISLLGGGWAFLLEFSTVIVLIFTLLILAIGGILKGEHVAPILAAIAGYVLGKASASSPSSPRPAEPPKSER